MIIGVGLFVYRRKVVDIFLRAIRSDAMNTQAGTLLDFVSIQYFKERKFEKYDWQGNPRKDSSAYHYKAGWDSLKAEHHYLTKIIRDVSGLMRMKLTEIKQQYKNGFVLPYDLFQKQDHEVRISARKG